jgi:hypothetical protein
LTNLAIPTTFGAIDTTNLTVSFTAPASGKVLVRLTGAYTNDGASSTPGKAVLGMVTHSTSTLMTTAGAIYGPISSASYQNTFSMVLRATGLASGTAYQWDLAGISDPSAAQLSLYMRNAGAASNYGTPFEIEVVAL